MAKNARKYILRSMNPVNLTNHEIASYQRILNIF